MRRKTFCDTKNMTKIGRPKVPEKQAKKNFPLRISDAERDALQRAADKEGMKLPDWIRKKLAEAAEKSRL